MQRPVSLLLALAVIIASALLSADTLMKDGHAIVIGKGKTTGNSISWTDCRGEKSAQYQTPPYWVDKNKNCEMNPQAFGIEERDGKYVVVDAKEFGKYFPGARKGDEVSFAPIGNGVRIALKGTVVKLVSGIASDSEVAPERDNEIAEKDEETLKKAAAVLQKMLNGNNVPADLLAKADCVMVLPGVKKFGVGIGGSGGRGPMSCRTGEHFKGKWSAPAMFRISSVSAGLQLGGSSSDFVLLIMSDKGLDAILKGKTKLGSDATAAAGPSGATAGSVGESDVFTYGKAKGLFAGVSLGSATLDPDEDANKRLYGKAMSAREIVRGNAVPTPTGGEPLVSLLNSKAAKRSN